MREQDEYRPVACAVHSTYEAAIVQRRRLRLRWTDPDGTTRDESVQPLDVLTEGRAEYLVLRDAAGERIRLRLDRIASVAPE